MHRTERYNDRIEHVGVDRSTDYSEVAEAALAKDSRNGGEALAKEFRNVEHEKSQDWWMLMCGHVQKRGRVFVERGKDANTTPLQQLNIERETQLNIASGASSKELTLAATSKLCKNISSSVSRMIDQ